ADPIAAQWTQEARLLLAERALAAGDPQAPVDVALPGRLSVSQLVTLRRDPATLARLLRRPMPARPDPEARRGTAFHRWLERRYAGDRLFDFDDWPEAAAAGGASGTGADPAPDADRATAGAVGGDETLADLQRRFEASEWADRIPLDVEVPFSTVVDGVVLRGRMDAVFAAEPTSSGAPCFEVVDWKTGAVPVGAAARAARVQLAAYRLAFAKLRGVSPDRVRGAFYYVHAGVTVRPDAEVAMVAESLARGTTGA
ncbi:MAG: hypothetical protein HKP61_06595, partial [Dactylosporangium sp.]|nr:PD-(D/E)XK nuclease family protein [Dactylosporangium sp.]NNJ60614.1 hypothetical protein [Dactylosporangium sp.]